MNPRLSRGTPFPHIPTSPSLLPQSEPSWALRRRPSSDLTVSMLELVLSGVVNQQLPEMAFQNETFPPSDDETCWYGYWIHWIPRSGRSIPKRSYSSSESLVQFSVSEHCCRALGHVQFLVANLLARFHCPCVFYLSFTVTEVSVCPHLWISWQRKNC